MAVLGIDVGGTFTDAVLLHEGRVHTAKVPTLAQQEDSVLEVAALVLAHVRDPVVERFTHGTTIATNALLERKGARTAFVTNEGFEHLLHLRRQSRAHLYRLDLAGCGGRRRRRAGAHARERRGDPGQGHPATRSGRSRPNRDARRRRLRSARVHGSLTAVCRFDIL